MSALSFKIDAETDKLNSFIASLERLNSVLEGIPSGTKEFDVMNRKIAEMEARVEQYMKKIAQMQGEAARTVQQAVASSPTTSPHTTANAAADNAAYQDLLETLKAVNASKEENVSLISHYQAQIASLKAQIQALNEEERKGLKLSDQQKTTRFAATVSIEEYKQALSRSRRELANQIKLEQVAVGSIDEMSQALGRMRTVYRSLNESERGSSWGQNLLKQIETLDTKIKELDASMGVHSRNVGNYASGFNGLQFQIQQVARELPSLAYGLQTLFVAVSNNIPMLGDEIRRARIQYAEALKAGQQATPVWRQILSSIFSWQTALVAGVTVLSMFGKEITEWVGSLFKGKKVLDSAKIAAEQFRATMVKGAIDAQGEVTKLNLLYRAATDLSKPYKERAEAVKKLQDIYPAYFGNMSAEQVMVGNAVGAYENLRDAIIQVAEAKAAQELIIEDEKSLQLIKKTGSAYAKYSLSLKEYKVAYAAVQEVAKKLPSQVIPFTQESKNFENAKANILRFREEFISALSKLGEEGDDLWKRIDEGYKGDVDAFIAAINAGIEKLTPAAEKLYTALTPDELNAEAEKARQEAQNAAQQAESKREKDQEDLEKALKKLRDDALQAEIDAMPEGTAKRVAQIELDYSKRAEAIREGEEKLRELQGGEITTEQQTQIQSLHAANDATRTAQKGNLASASKDAWNEYLLKFGTFKERVLATEEKYNREIAAAGTEGERALLLAEKQQALAELEVEGSEWAQGLVTLTVERLEEMRTEIAARLQDAQDLYNKLGSSSSPAATIMRGEIAKLDAQMEKLDNQISKTKKTADSGKDWEKTASALQDVASGAREAAEGIREFDEGLADILVLMADVTAGVGTMIAAIGGIEKGMSALDKASAILTAISAGIQVVSAVFGALGGGENAIERTRREFAELNDEIVRLKREAEINSWKGTIFGEDPYRGAIENMRLYTKALEGYINTQERIKNRMKSIFPDAKAWQTVADSIANMQVKTRHSTWVRDAKYQSLGSLLPGIFNEDGSINMPALKEFQGSDLFQKLAKDNQKLINDFIRDWELYEQALDEVKGYLSNIFGDLGNTLTDALADAFVNGTDAAKTFADSVSNMLEQLAKEMVQTIYFAPLFKKAQEDIVSIMGEDLSDEERFSRIAKILGNLTRDSIAAQDDALATMEFMREEGKKYGLNLFNPKASTSTTATSGGFETMSQDTGSELNGRFTDIQGKVTDIRGFVMTQTPQIIALLTSCQHIELIQVETIQVGHELLRYAVMIYMEVTEINSTTKSMLKVLNNMDERLSGIERNTDNL